MEPSRPVVLVVEDEVVTRRVLTQLLEQDGYVVEAVASGEAGLARIAEGGIDVVLLDLMLPGLDGIELTRRVRENAEAVYLPIIMVTSLDSPDQQHSGFEAGADDYVTKPFNTRDLLDRVRVWTRTSQRLQASHSALVCQWLDLLASRPMEPRRAS
jgi:two-component system response regulator RegX3